VLEAVVPVGSTARIELPTRDAAAVNESGAPVAQAAGVQSLGQAGGRLLVVVGSGTYRFTVQE
jgi:alpha-L-rhamnosidase